MLDEGLQLALEWHGIGSRVVGYAEREASAAAVLLARMEESSLECAPIWADNLEDLVADQFRGVVDGVAGGIPCQPDSQAGLQRGTDDERWLWDAFWRFAQDVGAGFIAIENVGGFVRGSLPIVVHDLAEAGWIAEWCCLRASDVGAAHQRERIFLLAHSGLQHGNVFQRARGISEYKGSGSDVDNSVGFGRGSGRRIDGGDDGIVAGAAGEESLDDTAGSRSDGTGSGPGTEQCGGKRLPGAGCADVGNSPGDDERRDTDREDGEGFAPRGSGGAVGFSESEQRRAQQQPGESPERGRPRSAGAGGDMADAECESLGSEQREESGKWAGAGEVDESVPGRESEHVANADGDGQRAGGSGLRIEGREFESRGVPSIFAPGPQFAGWGAIIANAPHLAPAVEPGVRVLVDGVAYVVDAGRADQLRAAGNGVVALQAAVGYAVLIERLLGREG